MANSEHVEKFKEGFSHLSLFFQTDLKWQIACKFHLGVFVP